VNAFILAGGQSIRMGRDKALLHFRGRPLIEYALAKLRTLGFSPAIAGNRPDLAGYAPVIADNYLGSGPLAGIEAAIASSNDDLNLFLPVDLPLLPIEFLSWMTVRALQTSALATIPRLQSCPQPLCALYHRVLLPYARSALSAGKPKVMRAVQLAASESGLKMDLFDVETLAASLSPSRDWPPAPPVHRWFQNLNSPAELQFAALEESPHIQ
jgi:molybdopterin-guanine dinucleotide biosynthesis protein A